MGRFNRTASLLLASSALLVGAGTAHGQGTPEATDEASEIVVTAQKRSERLIDVPLSITAASGDQLVRQGVTDTALLTKIVPGFTFQQGTFGSPVFAIRGVGFYDNSFLAGPAVTAYVDQVPLPFSIMTRGATLDLERVEALKGPQGTLFGQNSTGGAINFIAAKPTSSLKAGIDVGFGRFNEATATAFVSGPLAEGLRARVAVSQEYMGGWQRSATRPGDTNGRKRFYNGRLLLDWTPTERLTLAANVSGWQDQSDSLASQFVRFVPIVPVTPRSQFVADALLAAPKAPRTPRVADWNPGFDFARNNKFYLLSLRADWAVADAINLTSITAYSHLTVDMPIDADGTAFDNFSYEVTDGRVTNFSQELRLSGEWNRFKGMIGGNYQRQQGREYQILSDDATNGVSGPFFQNASAYLNRQRPTTKSVFGSIDYTLTDQLTAQVSARYSKERRRFDGCLADAGRDVTATTVPIRIPFAALSSQLSGSPTSIAPFGCITLNDATAKPGLVQRTLTEDNVAWRAGVNWKPSEDALVYANVSRGYKSGSFSTLPAVFASQFAPVTQESVLAYEAGVKASLLDRRVQATGAVFYYDYQDKQLVGNSDVPIFGPLPKLINIPKSRVVGAELELVLRPVDGLRISGGVTYVDSKVKADPLAPDRALNPLGDPVTFVGEAFSNTPKWQGVSDAEYGYGISSVVNGFFGGSLTVKSGSYAALGELSDYRIPGYALVDLRAGVESRNGDWRLQIWGRNITNKFFITNVSNKIDALIRTVGMPATYGASFSYRY